MVRAPSLWCCVAAAPGPSFKGWRTRIRLAAFLLGDLGSLLSFFEPGAQNQNSEAWLDRLIGSNRTLTWTCGVGKLGDSGHLAWRLGRGVHCGSSTSPQADSQRDQETRWRGEEAWHRPAVIPAPPRLPGERCLGSHMYIVSLVPFQILTK